MRTREDQIEDLAQTLVDETGVAMGIRFSWRENTSSKPSAARRAEQRVRAEIGRDSERLDWLDRACVHAYEPKQYFDGIGCGVCRVSHRPTEGRNLREAIDAAREVG